MKRRVILAVLALAATAQAEEWIAVEGATVWVDPSTKLERATVLVHDGVIAAVGSGVSVPPGAKRIDGTGTVVTAGLVDVHTNLGLVEVSLETPTVEGAFAPTVDEGIHAAYRVTDGYNPASVVIPVARRAGVTGAVTVPRGGLVAGSSAWVSLADGANVETATIMAPLAMHAVLGEGALAAARGSRGLAVERLRELLDDAVAYARHKDAFERNQTRRFAASRLDLEALLPVATGKLPLVVEVNRAADIMIAIRLAKEAHLRLVVAGGAEAWKVADELARAGVAVILDPSANLPGSFDTLYVRDDAVAILVAAGVSVAISTFSEGASVRILRQLAGIAVRDGLPWAKALEAVTSGPAAIFAVPRRGTLAKGNVADLVVWSGDPFELSTRALHVLIGGKEQSLVTRQTRLLQRYESLPPR